MIVEDSYNGPRLDNGIEELNKDWVINLLGYMKDSKILHKKICINDHLKS